MLGSSYATHKNQAGRRLASACGIQGARHKLTPPFTAFKIPTFDQYVLILIAGPEVKLASSINPVQLPGRIIAVTEKISEGEKRRERERDGVTKNEMKV